MVKMRKEKHLAEANTPVKVRTVDGGVYFITCNNPIDYLLHTDFLRFVIAICIIYAMLHGDGDVPGLSGWPFLAVWTFVFALIFTWLAVCGHLILVLLRHQIISQIWTPLLLLPLNLLIESSVQVLMFWLVDQPFKPWATTLTDFTRDFAILLLIDFLHGHYVVARHPYARFANTQATDEKRFNSESSTDAHLSYMLTGQQKVQTQLEIPRDDANKTRPIGHGPIGHGTNAPQTTNTASSSDEIFNEKVRIGAETYALGDILMIRIEDHYLNVTTRSGRTMPRAKLSSIERLHNGNVGIQINRSVWVAFWAIQNVQAVRNGQLLLQLENGDEELVAKPRVYAFRQSYRAAKGEST